MIMEKHNLIYNLKGDDLFMKIFIKNDVIESNLSNDAFATYVAISCLSNVEMDYVLFNSRQIGYALYGKLALDKRKLDRIKKSISELILSECIEVIEEEKGDYIIKNKFTVDGSDGKFTIIQSEEVKAIMNIKKGDNESLLRYFTFIISTIHGEKKVGWWTIDQLREKLNIGSNNTIIAYNKLLEDAKLIYIHRPNITVNDEFGTPKRISNTYGRYGDRGRVINSSNEYINSLGVFNGENNNVIVDGRSISAKYNAYVRGIKNGKEYDIKYVEELRLLCEQYNAYYEKFAGAKLKDMSVFDVIPQEDDEPIIYFNKPNQKRLTAKFVKDWANGVVDNTNKYSFGSMEFLKELSRVMNGKSFNNIEDEDATVVYTRMNNWIKDNDIEEDLPY